MFLHAFMPNSRTTSIAVAVKCSEKALRRLQAYVSVAESGGEYLGETVG